MSTATATRYTPDDLLTMPGGERCELVDGELVEKPIGAEADWVGMRLIANLIHHLAAAALGEVFGPETGDQCFADDPRKVRKPDGSVIAAGRLPGGHIPKGHIRIAPDLAFEVVSPNDTNYGVEAKVREYLDAGVRLVWVLNPDLRTIRVYESSPPRTFELSPADDLTAGPILPGFRCAVGDLFPPVT